jgi:hypothetical protein
MRRYQPGLPGAMDLRGSMTFEESSDFDEAILSALSARRVAGGSSLGRRRRMEIFVSRQQITEQRR